MRTVLKIAAAFFVLLVVVVAGMVVWVQATWRADYAAFPKPPITASADPAVVARGAYVVHAVAHCNACHQAYVDGDRARPDPDPTKLIGGFAMNAGPFGTYYPANLTPDPETGIGALDDAALARAIRHGVARDGALSTAMALSVGAMADEDLVAVISYLRSLPPRKNAVPPSRPAFLGKVTTKMASPNDERPPAFVPPGGVSVERGRYVVNGPGFCYGCHSDPDLSTFKPAEPRLSGAAMAEPDPTDDGYEFAAPNLTPDPTTGVLVGWTEDAFVARFRKGRVYAGSKMPWESFAQMTDDDLRSVYRFLQTLPPVAKQTGPSRRPNGWRPADS